MITRISNIVEDYFRLPEGAIKYDSRKREVVQARQIAMVLSKQLTKKSLDYIGKQLADRDHATVLHAIKTVNNLIDTDKEFKKTYFEICEKVDDFFLCNITRDEINEAIQVGFTKLLIKKIQQCKDLTMMLSQTQTR